MTYRAPVDDMAFALTHSAGMGRALDDGLYGDLGPDDIVLEGYQHAPFIKFPIAV